MSGSMPTPALSDAGAGDATVDEKQTAVCSEPNASVQPTEINLESAVGCDCEAGALSMAEASAAEDTSEIEPTKVAFGRVNTLHAEGGEPTPEAAQMPENSPAAEEITAPTAASDAGSVPASTAETAPASTPMATMPCAQDEELSSMAVTSQNAMDIMMVSDTDATPSHYYEYFQILTTVGQRTFKGEKITLDDKYYGIFYSTGLELAVGEHTISSSATYKGFQAIQDVKFRVAEDGKVTQITSTAYSISYDEAHNNLYITLQPAGRTGSKRNITIQPAENGSVAADVKDFSTGGKQARM